MAVPTRAFIYYFAVATAGGVALLLYTIYLVILKKPNPTQARAARRDLWVLLLLWTLLPPAWFSIEYFQLYGRYGLPGTLDQFKYGQELASKFWAGGVALVIAKLFQEKERT